MMRVNMLCKLNCVLTVNRYHPWQTYQQDLKRDDFVYDAAQENAVRHLQRLYDDLTRSKTATYRFFCKAI